jgi:hypothetical protein
MVIREAKITENDKLILNSRNKVKSTWGVINKKSGKNKKKVKYKLIKLKVKKITDQQTIAETFNEYFIATAEIVKRQSKNNFVNDDNDNMDSHTRFMQPVLLNLTQVWNGNAQQQKKLNKL